MRMVMNLLRPKCSLHRWQEHSFSNEWEKPHLHTKVVLMHTWMMGM